MEADKDLHSKKALNMEGKYLIFILDKSAIVLRY